MIGGSVKSSNIWGVMNESGTDDAECHRKVVSGGNLKVVNSRGLQLECARVLHGRLLVPVLLYGNEIVMSKNGRCGIRAVEIDNLKGLLGVTKTDRLPNAWIRVLWSSERG